MPDSEDTQRAMHAQYIKMTETPVSRLILSLAVPTTISMLITNIYNMADTYFVSSLSVSASGATGIVFSLMAILQAFGFMFGHGAGSCISRQLGSGDIQDARRFASTSFFLALASGGAVCVLGLLFLDPLMRLLGSTETILPYARTYAVFILLAGPAMTTGCVMNNILRYEGYASLAMVGLTTGGLLNIGGDWLLMRVLGMGIAGAGLSTLLSQYISMGILLSMFLRKKTQSRIALRWFTRSPREVLTILATGSPSLARQGLNSISSMALNLAAGPYGDAAIAAFSIVSRCIFLLQSVTIGIGQGFQPVSGFNYGAGKYSRVRRGTLFVMGFGAALAGVFASLCFAFAPEVIRLFRNEPEVVQIGATALWMQCGSLVVLPVSVAGNMLFQSIGKSGRAFFLACSQSGLFFLPLIVLLPRAFGLTGIEMAQPLAWALSVAVTVPIVVQFWKTLPQDAE